MTFKQMFHVGSSLPPLTQPTEFPDATYDNKAVSRKERGNPDNSDYFRLGHNLTPEWHNVRIMLLELASKVQKNCGETC